MSVTLFGIAKLVKLPPDANDAELILVALFGRVTLLRLEQPQKALFLMLVTLSGIV